MASLGRFKSLVRRRALVATLIGVVVPVRSAVAQGYYNLDAGRPVRVEDATPAARYELGLQLLPVRFERFASGAQRWRTDPKISFGVAAFTEIEVRVPYLVVNPPGAGASVSSGLGGVAFGALHALTLETGAIPAIAVAGEWIAPIGALSAPVGSYSAKLIGTKTFELLRFHVNLGYGTWSTRQPATVLPCPKFLQPGEVPPAGCGGSAPSVPVVPDTPCDRAIDGARFACIGASASMPEATASAVAAAGSPPSVGYRWVSGIGIDRAFALLSTLVSADVVAERFMKLYDTTDLSAELGLRHQLTPTLVIDLGIGRHFTGALMSNTVTAGFSYGAPRQPFRAQPRPE